MFTEESEAETNKSPHKKNTFHLEAKFKAKDFGTHGPVDPEKKSLSLALPGRNG